VFVGIDVGGTKTHLLAAAGDDTVLDLVVPTAQWRHEGLHNDADVERLLELFRNLPGGSESALVVGAHGLDTDAQVLDFELRLRRSHSGPVRALNDVELLGPATGYADAIAVVAGTGSKVVARTANGASLTAGGYGYLFSDPGSAPGLAREAVRAVLDAQDSGQEPDALAEGLMAHFAVPDVDSLAHTFAAHARIQVWAPAAPVIFAAADEGSHLAAAVIDVAAADLAHGVDQVCSRGAVGTHVVCAGGVISNQSRLYDAFARHVSALGRPLSVHLLTVPPVQGALALSRQLIDTNMHQENRRSS